MTLAVFAFTSLQFEQFNLIGCYWSCSKATGHVLKPSLSAQNASLKKTFVHHNGNGIEFHIPCQQNAQSASQDTVLCLITTL